MNPWLDIHHLRPEVGATMVAGLALVALGLGQAHRLPSPWRGVARGLAGLGLVRIALLGNPWIWQFYSQVHDPHEIGWRQADVIRHQLDDQFRSRPGLRWLAVGSSQTGRIYGEYAKERDDLDVFVLSAMTPLDMVLHEEAIARRRPAGVLLYLSDFDIAREPPGNALVTAPRQGLRLPRLWAALHALPMGDRYDGPMAELLLGEVFPEAKYGFVLRGTADKVMHRVAARAGRPDPPRETSARDRVAWLRDSFDERYVELNLHFLREFSTRMRSRNIEVVIVEGRYNPVVADARTRPLAQRVREDLAAMARDIEGVVYLPSEETLVLGEDDFDDLSHVTEEVGQRLARRVIARAEGRPAPHYNPAATPAAKESAQWRARAADLEHQVRQGPAAPVVLLGDSIIEGWQGPGKDVWRRVHGEIDVLNLAVSADRTEHVLWRLQRLELERLRPKAIVVLIGTNNCVRRSQTAAEIAEAIGVIVSELRERLPETHVLLLGLFPRGEPSDPARHKAAEVNSILATLVGDAFVHYLDLGAAFVDGDGRVRADLMPDQLHLSTAGYEVWARHLEPALAAILDSP